MRTNTFGGLTATLILTLSVPVAGCFSPMESGDLVPQTVDEDPSLPQLSFNNSTFHVEAFGDEDLPVIVMLHGGPGADYRGLLGLRQAVDGRRLEDTHRVVYWDQRSSGLSQRHDADEISFALYDRDLDWIVEHFSPGRPVVLLGHSWGGMYATRYISNHPERVAGAVLIEPGPLTGELFEDIKDEIMELDFFSEWLNDLSWARGVISPDDHARADLLVLSAILAPDSQPGYGVDADDLSFWRVGAVANAEIQNEGLDEDGVGVWDFTVGLDDFETETLFIASGDNVVLGEEFQQRQMELYPSASLTVIPNAGHEVPTTHPEQTLRAVFNYVDAL